MMSRASAARLIAEMHASRKCALWTPCGRVEQFLQTVNLADWTTPAKTSIFILRGGNQGGKTVTAINIASYLASPYPHEYLDAVDYLRTARRPNVGRIFTTLNAASTTYATALPEWLDRTTYTSTKGHNTYPTNFNFGNGSRFDIFSVERSPMEAESTTLDWAIADEPLPYEMWTALKSRFSHGGIIIMVLTALEGSGWMSSELECAERLGKDVFVTVMDLEDTCKIHGVRGYRDHEYIESLMRDCSEDEIDARVHGKYITLSGCVYKKFDPNRHIISTWPTHLHQWWRDKKYRLTCVIDPHDRKPFAIGWYATFPNGDTVCVEEFPDDEYKPFHKLDGIGFVTRNYVDLIRAKERAIGKAADRRLIDPRFAVAPCFSSQKSIQQEFAENGLHFDLPPYDPIDHQAVKTLLGDGANLRPKLFFFKHCTNHIFGMQFYQYKNDRKQLLVGEKPALEYKDFPDIVRYGAISGAFEWRETVTLRTEAALPKVHGASGYRGL